MKISLKETKDQLRKAGKVKIKQCINPSLTYIKQDFLNIFLLFPIFILKLHWN